LCKARDSEGKIGFCFPRFEEVSEEVPQMRGKSLIAERWLSRRQLQQKGYDVGGGDLRKISGFFPEPEGEEAVGQAPATEDRSVAQPALLAQIFFIVPFEKSAPGIVGCRFQRGRRGSQVGEETSDDEAVVLNAVRRSGRFCNQLHRHLRIEILRAYIEGPHLAAESADTSDISANGVGTVVLSLQMFLRLLRVYTQRAGARHLGNIVVLFCRSHV
jgi:hypothetical protein